MADEPQARAAGGVAPEDLQGEPAALRQQPVPRPGNDGVRQLGPAQSPSEGLLEPRRRRGSPGRVAVDDLTQPPQLFPVMPFERALVEHRVERQAESGVAGVRPPGLAGAHPPVEEAGERAGDERPAGTPVPQARDDVQLEPSARVPVEPHEEAMTTVSPRSQPLEAEPRDDPLETPEVGRCDQQIDLPLASSASTVPSQLAVGQAGLVEGSQRVVQEPLRRGCGIRGAPPCTRGPAHES